MKERGLKDVSVCGLWSFSRRKESSKRAIEDEMCTDFQGDNLALCMGSLLKVPAL